MAFGLLLSTAGLFGQTQNPCRLLLPKVVYAAPGQETNIYFDNVILAPPGRAYLFDITCAKGKQFQNRWTFTPEDADAGDLPLELEVRDMDDKIVARGSTTIRIGKPDGGHQTVSLLPIGDSLTQGAVYTGELLRLFNARGISLVLFGSSKTENSANNHEGYGGWRFQDFAEKFEPNPEPGSPAKRSSPFVFAGHNGVGLDVSRYLKENFQGASPEFITLFLGVNDNFGCTDATLEKNITAMLGYSDKLIRAIRSACPKATIGIVPPVPPAASQDAFGADYGCGQTRWQYRKNQHRVVERMLEKFQGQEAQGIYLVPAYVNIDCLNNYPGAEQPANARATTNLRRMNNGVHPSAEGYQQIADSIFSWMACCLQGNRE